LKKFKVIIIINVKDWLHQFHMKSFKRSSHTYAITLHTHLSTSKIEYKCHMCHIRTNFLLKLKTFGFNFDFNTTFKMIDPNLHYK
jgi:hypothetical protein